MPTWPSALPQAFPADAYREAFEDRRIIARTETGPGKVRPRGRASLRRLEVGFEATASQVATLRTFYGSDTLAGATRFTFPHPRKDGTVEARFIRPPRLRPYGGDLWEAALALDYVVPPTTGLGALVWPPSLPLAPLIEAYDEQFADLALVGDDLGSGLPEIRRRTTAAAAPLRTTFRLTGPQVETLEKFYEGDTVGGCLPFTWTHPRDGEVRTAFAGGPEIRALGGDLYDVVIPLEVLP